MITDGDHMPNLSHQLHKLTDLWQLEVREFSGAHVADAVTGTFGPVEKYK